MALSADATNLSTLLAALTHPDTNAIRQAEVALKPLLKDARCVPALVEIVKAQGNQVSDDVVVMLWLTVHVLWSHLHVSVGVICTYDMSLQLQILLTF